MTASTEPGRGGRRRAFAWCAGAYLLALGAALAAGWAVRDLHPLLVVAVADGVGTAVVFAFSFALGNSSMYDPYWSVAPIPIALYWLLAPGGDAGVTARQVLVVGAVCLWGVRLTHNFLGGWRGLHHEDWRYVKLRWDTGGAYWLVSLLGIHLMPTALVYAGCLSLAPAMSAARALGPLDAVAAVVTFGAIAMEALADRQLRRFVRHNDRPGRILDRGLWLFGVAASPEDWAWTLIGPVAITLLFVLVSIPMIERRMASRRKGWDAHRRRVSMLVPLPPRR